MGLISDIDRNTFAIYCETWALWLDRLAAVHKQGVVVAAPSGYPIQNPHYTIANQLAGQLARYLEKFGLSPSDRTRVKAEPVAAPSPLNRFLKGGRGH